MTNYNEISRKDDIDATISNKRKAQTVGRVASSKSMMCVLSKMKPAPKILSPYCVMALVRKPRILQGTVALVGESVWLVVKYYE